MYQLIYFFYRDANKVAASQEKSKKLEQDQQQQSSYLQQGGYSQQFQGGYVTSDNAGFNLGVTDAQNVNPERYDALGAQDYDQPPEDGLADWGQQDQSGAFDYNQQQQQPPPPQAQQYYQQPPQQQQQQQQYDDSGNYGAQLQEW